MSDVNNSDLKDTDLASLIKKDQIIKLSRKHVWPVIILTKGSRLETVICVSTMIFITVTLQLY